MSNTFHDQEGVSKVFPPLIWEDLTFKQRAVWPFPVVNSQRTPESLTLMAKKHVKSKPDDFSDMEEATW